MLGNAKFLSNKYPESRNGTKKISKFRVIFTQENYRFRNDEMGVMDANGPLTECREKSCERCWYSEI